MEFHQWLSIIDFADCCSAVQSHSIVGLFTLTKIRFENSFCIVGRNAEKSKGLFRLVPNQFKNFHTFIVTYSECVKAWIGNIDSSFSGNLVQFDIFYQSTKCVV